MSSSTSGNLNNSHPGRDSQYQDWHKSWIEKSATLVELDQAPDHLVCRKCKVYMKRDTGSVIPVVSFIAAVIIGQIITGIWFHGISGTADFAIDFGVLEILVFLQYILPWTRRNSAEGNLLKELITAITWMESRHNKWQEPRYRREACRKLEKIARSVDWMPHVIPANDDQNRSKVATRSSEVATSLRDFKSQILMPDLDGWDELRVELIERLEILLNTGWWNWPTRTPEGLDRKRTLRSKRRKTIYETLAAALLAALGIWLTTQPKPVSVIVASFALSTAVAIFGRAGVELSSLKDMSDLVKSAESKNSGSQHGS